MSAATSAGVGPAPAVPGRDRPGLGRRSAPRRTGPSSAARRDVGQPADVAPTRAPVRSTVPTGRQSTVALDVEVEPGRRPDRQAASHSGGSSAPRRRSERARPRPAGRAGRVVGHRDRREGDARDERSGPAAMVVPPTRRRRRIAVPPWSRRAIPKPLNRLVASSASEPRVGRLDRRQERLRPERQRAGRRRRRSTGRGTSRARIPSQTIAGKATSPRATGGQTTPARAIADRGQRRQPDDRCRAARPAGRRAGRGRPRSTSRRPGRRRSAAVRRCGHASP